MDALTSQFNTINDFLISHRQWWQFRPFECLKSPWSQEYPELEQALGLLSQSQLSNLHENEDLCREWLQSWIPELVDIPNLISVDGSPSTQCNSEDFKRQLHASFYSGIPGRKWQQIKDFSAQVEHSKTALVEWCAGKGFLGRLVSYQQQRPVTSLEWQKDLCNQGKELAKIHGVEQEFVATDVHSDEAQRIVGEVPNAVALHACGDLHTRLMTLWSNGNNRGSLVIAPCCYHLTQDDVYQPMSKVARASHLRLSKSDLSLPLQQTVTGGERIRRLREKELIWRMAFAEWYRHCHPETTYLPLPSIKQSQLSCTFNEFARWAIDKKEVTSQWDESNENDWLEKGQSRARLVRQMELVTHQFRRVLEVWLVLDRALYLQDKGAEVSISEFCSFQTTPRNLAIKAVMRAND